MANRKTNESAPKTHAGDKQLHKMGDILTASKAAMGEVSYEHGYPANENEKLNKNFSTGKGK
ncbi:MAG: hypothetical protein NVS1B2_15850 [Vulcanimicrobiaceae bacterium]